MGFRDGVAWHWSPMAEGFAPFRLQAGNAKGFASNNRQHGGFLGEGREKLPREQLGYRQLMLQRELGEP